MKFIITNTVVSYKITKYYACFSPTYTPVIKSMLNVNIKCIKFLDCSVVQTHYTNRNSEVMRIKFRFPNIQIECTLVLSIVFIADLVICGVAYHHAGLDSSDRKSIEGMFTNRELPVLCKCFQNISKNLSSIEKG